MLTCCACRSNTVSFKFDFLIHHGRNHQGLPSPQNNISQLLTHKKGSKQWPQIHHVPTDQLCCKHDELQCDKRHHFQAARFSVKHIFSWKYTDGCVLYLRSASYQTSKQQWFWPACLQVCVAYEPTRFEPRPPGLPFWHFVWLDCLNTLKNLLLPAKNTPLPLLHVAKV